MFLPPVDTIKRSNIFPLIKNQLSVGSDGTPNLVIMQCIVYLAEVATFQDVFPNELKIARVISILKRG